MNRVRSISSDQLQTFSQIGQPTRNGFPLFIQDLWTRGESHPNWCFLLWQGERPVARWAFKGDVADPRLVVLFALAGDIDAAAESFSESWDVMWSAGTREIHFTVPVTSLWNPFPEVAGFSQLQRYRTYIWEDPWPRVDVPDRLQYRSMEVMGEAAFFEALGLAWIDPPDGVRRRERAVLGERVAMERRFQALKATNHHSQWWECGWNEAGELVGVVCPSIQSPRVGEIGVLELASRFRGRGYELDLLARGTATLQSRGVRAIRVTVPTSSAALNASIGDLGGYQLEKEGETLVFGYPP